MSMLNTAFLKAAGLWKERPAVPPEKTAAEILAEAEPIGTGRNAARRSARDGIAKQVRRERKLTFGETANFLREIIDRHGDKHDVG